MNLLYDRLKGCKKLFYAFKKVNTMIFFAYR